MCIRDRNTAEITQNEVPPENGIFRVAERETTIEPLWAIIRNGPDWRGLTLLGAIAGFVGAVVFAERRPSTAIQYGGGLVGVGVVSVVIIFLIRFIVPLLAGGGSSANPVVATYAANTAPLVGTMLRLAVIGVAIALIGGIARLIWPDDWVYSNVSDERGVRSIKRRRGAPEQPQPQQPQQQVPVAAAVPVPYPGYPQPYPAPYPQQWQGYPGYGPPPGYPAPYPTGPFAQAASAAPQQYTSPGRPTVPVTPVQVTPGEDLVPPPAPALDGPPRDLPEDAAQIVPRVVAKADTTLEASAAAAVEDTSEAAEPDDSSARVAEPVPEPVVAEVVPEAKVVVPTVDGPAEGVTMDDVEPEVEVETDSAAEVDDAEGDDLDEAADEWAAEKDW